MILIKKGGEFLGCQPGYSGCHMYFFFPKPQSSAISFSKSLSVGGRIQSRINGGSPDTRVKWGKEPGEGWLGHEGYRNLLGTESAAPWVMSACVCVPWVQLGTSFSKHLTSLPGHHKCHCKTCSRLCRVHLCRIQLVLLVIRIHKTPCSNVRIMDCQGSTTPWGENPNSIPTALEVLPAQASLVSDWLECTRGFHPTYSLLSCKMISSGW